VLAHRPLPLIGTQTARSILPFGGGTKRPVLAT
jgi:hypothetical protein